MDYDVIVIGATFAAVGMLEVFGDKCLVLERRPQAGYEFLSALKYGTYDKKPVTDEGKGLLAKFEKKGAFTLKGLKLFDCSSVLYSYLLNKNVLLNMEIVSVDKIDDGFLVTAFGVSGKRCFTAKKVIDTTCKKDMISKKTINFLAFSETKDLTELSKNGIDVCSCGLKFEKIIKLKLEIDATYMDARKAVYDFSMKKEFEDCKIEYVADCFDIETKNCSVKEKDGIFYLTSCALENPVLAFDAGVSFAKEADI